MMAINLKSDHFSPVLFLLWLFLHCFWIKLKNWENVFLGFWPGPHWWEATVPLQLLNVNNVNNQWRDSHKKNGWRCSSETLKRTPFALWVWLEILGGSNSKTMHYLISYFLTLYPKRYFKSFCCEPFKAKHPRRKQNRFLTPKGYDKDPYPFCMGSPPREWTLVTWIWAPRYP